MTPLRENADRLANHMTHFFDLEKNWPKCPNKIVPSIFVRSDSKIGAGRFQRLINDQNFCPHRLIAKRVHIVLPERPCLWQHQGQLNEQSSLWNRQKPLNRVWRGHTVADYPETKLLKSQIIDLKDLKSLIFSTDNFDNSSVSKLKPKCQIFRQSKESQFWFFQSKLFLKSNGR